MLRVPGSDVDLLIVKSRGADIRIVYSPLDCLKIARANPDKKVVFFGIGFETTAPANAMASALMTLFCLSIRKTNFALLANACARVPVVALICPEGPAFIPWLRDALAAQARWGGRT